MKAKDLLRVGDWLRVGSFVGCLFLTLHLFGQGTKEELRVILIRHAEKPEYGGDLSCQGMNRAKLLPALLYSRFGLPSTTYIPAPKKDDTRQSRMYQTIIPFISKYHLRLNSTYEEKDFTGIARDILSKKGTILVVWDHSRLPGVARALGIQDDELNWSSKDYDGIWIITFPGGKASLKKEKEGLKPSTACPGLI
jgi:hypothetical protein